MDMEKDRDLKRRKIHVFLHKRPSKSNWLGVFIFIAFSGHLVLQKIEILHCAQNDKLCPCCHPERSEGSNPSNFEKLDEN